jgi:hypothetical protein
LCTRPQADQHTVTILPTEDGRLPDAAHTSAFLKKIDGSATLSQFGLVSRTGSDSFAVFPAAFEINESEFVHHDTILVRKGNRLYIGVVVRITASAPSSPVPLEEAAAASANPTGTTAPMPVKRQRSHSPCQ